MFQTKLTMAVAIAIAIGSLALGIGAMKGQVKGTPLRREAPHYNKLLRKRATITIHVVDEDGKPVQGAHVFRNHAYTPNDGGRPSIENKDYRTGADGKAVVDLSGASVDLRLWVTKADFVPLFAIWAKALRIRWRPDSGGIYLPAPTWYGNRRQRCRRARQVDRWGQGRVQNLTADHFHTIPLKKTPGQRPVRSPSLTKGANAIVTDERGRWKLGNVPADKDLVFDPRTLLAPPIPLEIELHLSHPDHVSDEIEWGVLQRQQGVTLKSLRDQTAKIVLVRK